MFTPAVGNFPVVFPLQPPQKKSAPCWVEQKASHYSDYREISHHSPNGKPVSFPLIFLSGKMSSTDCDGKVGVNFELHHCSG